MKQAEELRIEMYHHLAQWQESGLNMKEFCTQHNISYYKFKYWKKQKQISDSIVNTAPFETSKGEFLPIGIKSGNIDSELTITYPNGVQLHCPDKMDLSKIIQLIKTF